MSCHALVQFSQDMSVLSRKLSVQDNLAPLPYICRERETNEQGRSDPSVCHGVCHGVCECVTVCRASLSTF